MPALYCTCTLVPAPIGPALTCWYQYDILQQCITSNQSNNLLLKRLEFIFTLCPSCHVASPHLSAPSLRHPGKNHQTPCNRFIRLSLTALINLCDHFHHKESASPCSRKSSDALPLPHRAPRRSENQAIALMPHKKNSPSILYLWISCSHSIFYVGATSEVT